MVCIYIKKMCLLFISIRVVGQAPEASAANAEATIVGQPPAPAEWEGLELSR